MDDKPSLKAVQSVTVYFLVLKAILYCLIGSIRKSERGVSPGYASRVSFSFFLNSGDSKSVLISICSGFVSILFFEKKRQARQPPFTPHRRRALCAVIKSVLYERQESPARNSYRKRRIPFLYSFAPSAPRMPRRSAC